MHGNSCLSSHRVMAYYFELVLYFYHGIRTEYSHIILLDTPTCSCITEHIRERALKRDKAILTSSKLMTTSRDMSTQITNWECGSCKNQHDRR